MKLRILLCLLIFANNNLSFSQGTWVNVSNYGNGNVEFTYSFSNGNTGFVGGGRVNGVYRNDLWEYDENTDIWTQKANLPSTPRAGSFTFSFGNDAYVGTGKSSTNYLSDFWKYDMITNVWQQKSNFPGASRYASIGFSITNLGYACAGYNGVYLADFWEYNPNSDSWTQKPAFPGGSRVHPAGFGLDGFGYVGMGYNSGTTFDDIWQYNPTTNSWLQKSDFAGGGWRGVVSVCFDHHAYIISGYDDVSYLTELWEYSPLTDQWNSISNFTGPGRYSAFGFELNNCIFLGTGSNNGVAAPVELNDVWKYCLTTGISEIQANNAPLVLPNPNNGNFAIGTAEIFKGPIQFKLYSTTGSLLLLKQLFPGEKSVNISLPENYSGVYFYRIEDEEGKFDSGKLIIVK